MSTTELLADKKPELITEVPDSVRQQLGETATHFTPEDAVALINKQLAQRPANASRPEIRAGDTGGIITQRGE